MNECHDFVAINVTLSEAPLFKSRLACLPHQKRPSKKEKQSQLFVLNNGMNKTNITITKQKRKHTIITKVESVISGIPDE